MFADDRASSQGLLDEGGGCQSKAFRSQCQRRYDLRNLLDKGSGCQDWLINQVAASLLVQRRLSSTHTSLVKDGVWTAGESL